MEAETDPLVKKWNEFGCYKFVDVSSIKDFDWSAYLDSVFGKKYNKGMNIISALKQIKRLDARKRFHACLGTQRDITYIPESNYSFSAEELLSDNWIVVDTVDTTDQIVLEPQQCRSAAAVLELDKEISNLDWTAQHVIDCLKKHFKKYLEEEAGERKS